MSNTPDFKSKEYLEHLDQLSTVSDIFNGVDSAKNHIKKFAREDSLDYQNRLDEATLDNYVFRTIDTIKNIIFRKAIDTTAISNKDVERWIEKINFKDNIDNFAKKVLKNRLRDGKTYILVDSPSYDPNDILSKADIEANNIRPYLVNILRSNLINWELNELNQYERITLQETYAERVGIYELKYKPQLRMFELIDGKVEVSIWREGAEVYRDRLTLDQIPLIEVGSDDIPPLYDQAKLNIKHLNRNSEKSNYVRVGAAPFPIVYGDLEAESGAKTLSINQGLKFNNKSESGFEWAEMSGKNYSIIQEEIKYIEEQMERISVEFVTELKNATATEVEKASTANESKLMDYSIELEEAINNALEMMNLYAPIGENIISTNKDFDSNILTSEQFNALMTLRTNGDISYDRLMDILEKGELLPILDEKERDTEKTLLRDMDDTI
jgi:hypothetical protein